MSEPECEARSFINGLKCSKAATHLDFHMHIGATHTASWDLYRGMDTNAEDHRIGTAEAP